MKLSKHQFCVAVRTYQSMLEEDNELIDVLNTTPEWKPSEWVNNYYELLTDLCELEVDEYIGTDLDWFCFETDFGKREDLYKIYDKKTGRTWCIESPEILYDYITRDE